MVKIMEVLPGENDGEIRFRECNPDRDTESCETHFVDFEEGIAYCETPDGGLVAWIKKDSQECSETYTKLYEVPASIASGIPLDVALDLPDVLFK